MMTRRQFLLAAAPLAALAPLRAAGPAAPVPFRALLILAGHSGQASDPRLKSYEAQLRRLFKFPHYAFLGEARQALPLEQPASLSLAGDFSVQVTLSPAAPTSPKWRAELTWRRKDDVLIRTSLTLSPGVPAILGGPSHADGNLILAVTAG